MENDDHDADKVLDSWEQAETSLEADKQLEKKVKKHKKAQKQKNEKLQQQASGAKTTADQQTKSDSNNTDGKTATTGKGGSGEPSVPTILKSNSSMKQQLQPIRILQRPASDSKLSAQDIANQKSGPPKPKTLEQREADYAEARKRILGSAYDGEGGPNPEGGEKDAPQESQDDTISTTTTTPEGGQKTSQGSTRGDKQAGNPGGSSSMNSSKKGGGGGKNASAQQGGQGVGGPTPLISAGTGLLPPKTPSVRTIELIPAHQLAAGLKNSATLATTSTGGALPHNAYNTHHYQQQLPQQSQNLGGQPQAPYGGYQIGSSQQSGGGYRGAPPPLTHHHPPPPQTTTTIGALNLGPMGAGAGFIDSRNMMFHPHAAAAPMTVYGNSQMHGGHLRGGNASGGGYHHHQQSLLGPGAGSGGGPLPPYPPGHHHGHPPPPPVPTYGRPPLAINHPTMNFGSTAVGSSAGAFSSSYFSKPPPPTTLGHHPPPHPQAPLTSSSGGCSSTAPPSSAAAAANHQGRAWTGGLSAGFSPERRPRIVSRNSGPASSNGHYPQQTSHYQNNGRTTAGQGGVSNFQQHSTSTSSGGG